MVRLKPGILQLLILRMFFLALLVPMSTFFVTDVVKSFDTVDRKYLGSGVK